MHLPCRHFSPAVTTSHFDESIITGTFDMSGSEATRFRKFTISSLASSSASSMFTSMTRAPSSTCLRAMESASSKFFSFISLRNFLLPATLHRSPTFTKRTSLFTSRSSRPESHRVDGLGCGTCGRLPCDSALYLSMNE